MYTITGRNVNQILPELMYGLQHHGREEETRNGKVLRLPAPAAITYEHPCERVLFCPLRDANPFFHLMESIWMLMGRNDLAFPASIVSSMADFSDDGVILQGAYGYRWRHHFGVDQLAVIANALRADKTCRRQVLQMWDAGNDLGLNSKDLPCNTQIYFAINDGKLDMTVTNRSNDAVWGALGANVVHMSMLLQFMAAWIEVPVGKYYQFSNNMHVYERHFDLMNQCAQQAYPSMQYMSHDPYENNEVEETPLCPAGPTGVQLWQEDAEMLLETKEAPLGLRTSFMRKVVSPMLQAIRHYKATKNVDESIHFLWAMPTKSDWRRAGEEWLERRRKNGKNISNLSR